MRLRNRHALTAVALVLAVVILTATAVEASAERPGRDWKTTRYDRKGAEITVEIPRLVLATGAGYREEYDVPEGWGFGFGLMWGISDNIAFEGRMLQSNHTADSAEGEKPWDIDQIKIGVRYGFLPETRVQPFVGAGWAKISMERDTGYESVDPFERLTGYGAYVALGVDYIYNSTWYGFFRADYTHAGYGQRVIGLEEEKLDKPLSGNCVSMTLGFAYRIPSF